MYSLTENVDVHGVHHEDRADVVGNSFSLRRVRFQVKSQINDRWDMAVLVNFAEFNSANLTGKVLENAFIRYSHSPHFKVMAGQFRPFFGVEDILPADFTRSFDFSNGYSSFSKNNWQGYQSGVTVMGRLNSKNLPLNYYAGVYNGNGKTLAKDSDNAKNAYLRLETDFKNFKTGVNAAIGSMDNIKGNAYGADLQTAFILTKDFNLEVVSEYKSGTNMMAYKADNGLEKPDVSQYQMRNFYFTPLLKYKTKKPRLRSVDFSARYEYLDDNYRLNPTARQTITPLIGLEFSDDYFALLQIGAVLENYKTNHINTSQVDQDMLLAQLQVKF